MKFQKKYVLFNNFTTTMGKIRYSYVKRFVRSSEFYSYQLPGFARFRSGNFEVKDALRSGRPITEKIDEIMDEVQENYHMSSQDFALALRIDHKTVLSHLNKVGFKIKLDIWVPHEISAKNVMDQIAICGSLLKGNEIKKLLN